MLLILDSVILLESVMFGIFSSDHRKKNRLFLLGVFIAGILSLAGVMHNNVLIWGDVYCRAYYFACDIFNKLLS